MPYWWNVYGHFEPDQSRYYPQPAQVLGHYRKKAGWSRAELASRLDVSIRAMHYMEQGRGLDSLTRRRQVCSLLSIPHILMGLCSQPLGENWWWSDYDPWPAGNDGWPHTGAVVKWYRRAAGWTQVQLAEALDITVLGVGKMENKQMGLDSMQRRRALCFLLSIPPILLGLDSVHTSNTAPAMLHATPTLTLPSLEELRSAQQRLWTGYYTSHGQDELQSINPALFCLKDALPTLPSAQYLEQLSLLYQAMGNILLAKANTRQVLSYMNAGITCARHSEDANLLSTALGRRSAALLELGHQQQAETSIREALAVASPQEVKKRFPVATRVLSCSALDCQDRTEVYAMLDSIVINDRYQNGVDHNIILWCRAQVLLNLSEHAPNRSRLLRDAQGLLDTAEKGAPDTPRRILIIKLAQARVAINLREYDYATCLALEAFALMKSLKSVLYMPQIVEIYRVLLQSSYASAPTTAKLGLTLFEAGAL